MIMVNSRDINGKFEGSIIYKWVTLYMASWVYNNGSYIPGSSDEQILPFRTLGTFKHFIGGACDKARTLDPERRGEGSGIGISAAVIKRTKLASRGRWPRLAALEKR